MQTKYHIKKNKFTLYTISNTGEQTFAHDLSSSYKALTLLSVTRLHLKLQTPKLCNVVRIRHFRHD